MVNLWIPDDIRYLNLYGIPYYIAWESLLPGYSFFLKTTATASMVQKALKPAAKFLRMDFKAHTRCEFGYYGVRVWRIA